MKLFKGFLIFIVIAVLLSNVFVNASNISSYSQYLSNVDTKVAAESVSVDLSNALFSNPDIGTFGNYEEKDSIVFKSHGGNCNIEFECLYEGLYTLEFEYFPIKNKRIDIELGIKIDDKYLYEDMKSFTLDRIFTNNGEIITDSQGNDYNPQQIEVSKWFNGAFYSSSGNYDSKMQIYLSQGKHKLTIESLQEPVALSGITFVPAKTLNSYEDYISKNNQSSKAFNRKIEAENTSLKSDYSLLAQTDRSSLITTPFSYTNQKLNIIGGETWKDVGQWLEWEIEVPEDGYYFIDFRYSQSYKQGLSSNRRLYINGSVPFAEANCLKFVYEPDWNIYSLKVNDEKVKYWLNKGVNTLRLEVVLGDVSKTTSEIDEIVYTLNNYYRQIIMITGSNPDTYRDYNLESEIPELINTLESVSKKLKDLYEEITVLTNGKGNSGNILNVLSYQLDDMIKSPSSIPFRMNSLSSNIGSLSSWGLEIKEQALDLDCIYISSEEKSYRANETFFQGLKREVLYFLYSFTTNYNSFETDTKDAISIWINTGRDQANIIRRMTDDLFTPQKNISVSIKMTSANAMQAFLSGNAPDVMLNVSRGLPVNLALRGALYDLTKFDDFDETVSAFSKTATQPYEIEGKVYALPETEIYYMLFSRDDVLKSLGLEKPNTWEEFYNCIQVLQLNGLYVGVSYTGVDSSTAVDAGIGSKNLFSAFLLQSGGSFYNKERTSTDLNSKIAIDAFEKWTDLYSRYNLPLSYNFFNRFRTGEMPLAIALYTEYNQIKAAAPEIAGLWSMGPIPGTKKEDGSIDRTQGGDGSACIITSTTKKADLAWEFLKWWTGVEAQTRYATDLEAIMGVAGRHPTANTEAMSNLQWTVEEYNALAEQHKYVVEIPVIAGSYYLTRGIDNAFRETVYDNRNAKESLSVWNQEIVNEINRKREEFFDEQ